MSRRLVFKRFFDSYFDGPVFNMDSMIASLRKLAGENANEEPEEINKFGNGKGNVRKKLGKKKKIQKKIKAKEHYKKGALGTDKIGARRSRID
jgi:hypothetical protein